MEEDQNTALKTGGIFVGIIAVLTIFLWFASSPANDSQSDESFSQTQAVLEELLLNSKNDFTQSSSILPPISPGADWLKESKDDPFLGEENAKIVIMEFSDFQCPFCKAAFPSIREITSEYKNIKYIYRDFPIDDIHPDARAAAEAAACANEQELFWPYHDRLFQNQHDLSDESLIKYSTQAGLDREQFLECFEEKRYAQEVENDRLIGVSLGVRGTPTWFINGGKIEGVITPDAWKRIIEEL